MRINRLTVHLVSNTFKFSKWLFVSALREAFSEFAIARQAASDRRIRHIRKDSDAVGGLVEDRWLSVDKIAAYSGIKRDTVYKWITNKRMPGHKVGRLWKFWKVEVND